MASNHLPSLTRRQALAGSVALAAAASLPMTAQAQDGANPLAIPPLDEGRAEGGIQVFDLRIAKGTTEFFSGTKTDTYGINADYLGPVLSLQQGKTVRLNVTNDLDQKATLHWHGFELPAWCDGGPHQMIDPGQTWSPEFPVRQRAGSYWYHGHRMGHTGEHVWMGMAGMIRVRDAESDVLGLPSTYGVDDFSIALQDRWFNRRGQLDYAPSMHDEMMGMTGNTPLANGTMNAFAQVPTGLVRLRLLNGSNASFYNLGFDDGAAFWQIATDGGLLTAPVRRNALLIAPGERTEIIIDMSDGQTRTLGADLTPIEGGMGMGGGMMGMGRGGARGFAFVQLRPTGQPGTGSLPDRLSDLAPANAPDGAPVRRFVLEMNGMGPAAMARRLLGGSPFTINGASMDMAVVNEIVPVNTTEIWEVENTSPMAHPFHVHNTQFRILTRAGQPPEAGEAGLKDTVVVWGGQTVRLAVRFEDNTDADRPYMYHCHILEHEDAGMMGQFTVV